MKKVVHAVAVYGPLALSGIIVLFLLTWLFGFQFTPYSGYLWCGITTAVCLLVCLFVKIDYDGRSIPKIEQIGILLLTSFSTGWWIYVWSVVEYTVILPFAAVCVVFPLFLSFKLCDDTVMRTLGLMAGTALAITGMIMWIIPVLSPSAQIKDRFNVYNDQSMVAKVTVIRDAGNVYDIYVVAKKTGGNLGLGRFERTEEISVLNDIVDVSEYQKPEVSWQGTDLYINGVQTDIYWE